MAIFGKKDNKISKSKKQEAENGENQAVPSHIAFIMDGNGRWAQKRGLPRSEGHKNAENAIISAITCSKNIGVETVTLFAFSTENWSREEEEKEVIFGVLEDFLSRFLGKSKKEELRVRILGDISPFDKKLQTAIAKIEEETKHFEKYNLNIALNYGGRQEILRACNLAVEKGEKVSAEDFEKLLYTAGQKDPDLVIRTSGEKRFSNFLLYQTAYSELYFAECLWPDFDEKEFEKAIAEYRGRKRRFGKA